MLVELAIRFVIGGLVVSIFALLGEIVRPKLFAGIFGAAPSVALATLGLTFAKHGGSYVGVEGRSMMAGGIALLAYSWLTGWLLMKRKLGTMTAAVGAAAVWFAIAFGVWGVALR